MLTVETHVPELRPVYRNARETVGAMTAHLRKRIAARTAAGQGADGPLPAAKDGNPGLRRTGTLLGAIGETMRWVPGAGARKSMGPVREDDGQWVGSVRAFGDRPASEATRVDKRAAAARVRTQQLRAAATIGGFLQHMQSPDSVLGRKRRGPGIRLSRVRVRTAVDNMSLAAILSVPPKDKRSINGNRASYRVFLARDSEQAEVAQIARTMLVVELVEVRP